MKIRIQVLMIKCKVLAFQEITIFSRIMVRFIVHIPSKSS